MLSSALVTRVVCGRKLQRRKTARGNYRNLSIVPLLIFASLLLNPSPTKAEEQQSFLSKTYVNISAYNAYGNQTASDFLAGFDDTEIDVSLTKYDTTRTAYSFAVGYNYHNNLAIELGYLDLGDAEVNFDSLSLTEEALADIVEENYPVSGEGVTLINQIGFTVLPSLKLYTGFGLYLWQGDIDASLNEVNRDLDGGVEPLVNISAQYLPIKNISLELHAKRVVFDQQHVDLVGIGFSLHFK